MQHEELFDKMGININSKGSKYFFSATEEVCKVIDTINNCDNEEFNLNEIIKSIMLEEYHFYYEIGRKKYIDELYKFVLSCGLKNKDNKIKDVFNNIDDSSKELSLEDKENIIIKSLIDYSNFCINNRDKDKEKQLKM